MSTRGRIAIRVTRTRRVVCEATVPLPLTAGQAWGQLRDFGRFAAHDFFHAGLRIDGTVPRAGAGLIIEHRYGPFRLTRVGRILRWREGTGFAFSDLPVAGGRRGFPHVLAMEVRQRGPAACELHVRVTGAWTAPTPRSAARIWLWWVFVPIVLRARNDLLSFALWRRRGRGRRGERAGVAGDVADGEVEPHV